MLLSGSNVEPLGSKRVAFGATGKRNRKVLAQPKPSLVVEAKRSATMLEING